MTQIINLQISALDFIDLVNQKKILLTSDDLEKFVSSVHVKPTFFNDSIFGSLRVSETEVLEGFKNVTDTCLLHLELI